MALDVASLTLDDSQASLASMPEELWRKIASYLRPAMARYLRFLDKWASDERFVRVQVMAGGDTEEIMERVKEFASSIMSLHISTRTFLCRRGEPPPDAAADEPEGGLEAYARHFM